MKQWKKRVSHLDPQQLAEVTQGHIGGPIIGEHLGGLSIGLGGDDLLPVDVPL